MERGCEKVYELGPLNEEELKAFAESLAKSLKNGDVVVLTGELGSGKTTFVRGMARGLGVDEGIVRSPTFTLLNVYPGRLTLNHADLYRIEDMEQLFYIGLEDFFESGEGILVVEWGEKFREFWGDRIEIVINVHTQDTRIIEVLSCFERGREIARETFERYEKEFGQVRGKGGKTRDPN